MPFLALGGIHQRRLRAPSRRRRYVAVERVVALALQLAREREQLRDVAGGTRSPSRRAGARARSGRSPARRTAGVDGGRRVHADRQPRHVDALRHHADGDHPPASCSGRTPRSATDASASSESTTAGSSPVMPAQDRRRRRARRSGRSRSRGRRHPEPARAPRSGGGPPSGAPRGSTPPPGSSAVRHACAVMSFVLSCPSCASISSPVLRAPAHLPGVDEEDHRAHDAVRERAPVAVAVVGARESDAVLVGVVLHERDGRGVAAERRARQQQAARGAPVRLAQRVAPAQRVAAVVHLVEDHEGARVLDERAGGRMPSPRPARR